MQMQLAVDDDKTICSCNLFIELYENCSFPPGMTDLISKLISKNRSQLELLELRWNAMLIGLWNCLCILLV